MLLDLRRAITASIVFFVILGLAYPLAETGIGQALFNHQANGSLTANGSERIGQTWDGPQWFHGRADGDDPTATGGSNLGPRSKELLDKYRERIAGLEKEGVTPHQDLVSASGSGVDPDISPDAAYAQVPSVAKARGQSDDKLRALVERHVQGPQFGFLGASHVNVLELNEELATLR
ncbi:potassium-transporting ATPase subunit C [Planotetraspora kaengkrachanensis]|uniref:Potassium-transporting ATPase KdpC subunit n=1 Tax=Planotetraspora kaengkrachanensis TaxID=575193 RepID=A0A8J3LTB3_9ACTN|nr:potassium-transporting ATPase subunit C [Planotetraspora kaengkrachanensis]GIG77309.1 potassium-transporting ATPase KdpC subunit [Planotetraspora kaengkrachanensis]